MGCFPFLKEVTVKWKSFRDSKVNSSSHDSKTTDSKNSKSGSRNSGDESCRDVSGSSREKSGVGPSASSSRRRSIPSLYKEKAHNLTAFSLVEMRSATRDFTPELKVGEGGFGPVYKGFIKNGNGSQSLVAIKKLNKHGLQGHKEWVAEVQTLGIIDHPNVVKLIGYCAVDDERGIQRMLVYEFMPNRSLDDHLFNKTLPVLPWNTRIILALGTAQGLAYLHEELEVQVIFRDFKASNVLLDDTFNPKLSDFGLAREGPEAGRTHVTTAVMGTAGYAAPEYVQTGHLTSKSDVWSFGVFLYELLTGRRSVEKNRPTNEQKLLTWVKHFPPESRTFHMIVDRRLRNQYSLVAAKKLAKLAESCIQRQSKSRPKMSEVVERLKEVIYISENDEYEPPSSEMVDADRPVELGNESNKVVGGVAEQKRRVVQLERMRNARGLNKLKTDIEQQQRK